MSAQSGLAALIFFCIKSCNSLQKATHHPHHERIHVSHDHWQGFKAVALSAVGELTISYLLIEVGEQKVAHVHENIQESEEGDCQPSLQELNSSQLGSNQGNFSNACSPAAYLPSMNKP